MYSNLCILLFITGAVLLVAMIGTIGITFKENKQIYAFIISINSLKKTLLGLSLSNITFYLNKYKAHLIIFFLFSIPVRFIAFSLISLFWLAPFTVLITTALLYIYIQCLTFKPL